MDIQKSYTESNMKTYLKKFKVTENIAWEGTRSWVVFANDDTHAKQLVRADSNYSGEMLETYCLKNEIKGTNKVQILSFTENIYQ